MIPLYKWITAFHFCALVHNTYLKPFTQGTPQKAWSLFCFSIKVTVDISIPLLRSSYTLTTAFKDQSMPVALNRLCSACLSMYLVKNPCCYRTRWVPHWEISPVFFFLQYYLGVTQEQEIWHLNWKFEVNANFFPLPENWLKLICLLFRIYTVLHMKIRFTYMEPLWSLGS